MPKGVRKIPRPSLKDRLCDGIIKSASTGCWIWTKYCNVHGYGVVGDKLKTVLAHRASYEAHFGKFNKKLCVLHKCDTPACINPEHLFLGTHKENMEDMSFKNRQRMKRKPHCARGHLLTKENTYVYPSGKHRTCRICARASMKKYRLKRRQHESSLEINH